MKNDLLIPIGGVEVLLMVVVILTILSIVDISRSNFKDNTSKIIWSLIVLFLPIIGILLYFAVGRNQKK
jgi:hypothetical protein